MSGLNKDIALIVADELRRYMPDLVEVVRCGKCKYCDVAETYTWCERFNRETDAEWFCADGERRENGTSERLEVG